MRIQRKTYLSWIIFYFSFIALFIVVVCLLYGHVYKILRSEVEKANGYMVDTMKASVDALLGECGKLSTNIAGEQTILECADAVYMDERYLQWNLNSVKNYVSTTISSYEYLEDIVVYFKDSDYVIDRAGVHSLEDYYCSNYADVQKNDESLKEAEEFGAFLDGKFFKNVLRNKNGNIVILQSFPISASRDSKGTIIIEIPSDRILQALGTESVAGQKNFFIVGDDILFSSENEVSDEMQDVVLAIEDGGFSKKVDGSEKIFTVTESEIKGIRYVYTVDKSVFWKKLNSFVAITCVGIMLLIFLGIIFVAYFMWKYYTPIRSIMDEIQKFNVTESKDAEDELSYINSAFSHIMLELQKSIDICDRNRNVIFENACRRYLNKPQRPFTSLMEEHGIKFEHLSYIMAIISVNDITNYFGSEDVNSDQEMDLVKFAIRNTYEELLRPDFSCLSVSMDENALCCIIGADSADIDIEIIKEKFRFAIEFLQENIGVYFSVVISEPEPEINSISRKYRDLFILANDDEEQSDILVYDALYERKIHNARTVNENINSTDDAVRDGCGGSHSGLVEKIASHIQTNYSDCNLNVNTLGDYFNLNPKYLSRMFKLQTGELLRDYIMRIRMQESKRMIEDESLKIADIASACGFLESGSFIRAFKKTQGITPGKYRETIRKV